MVVDRRTSKFLSNQNGVMKSRMLSMIKKELFDSPGTFIFYFYIFYNYNKGNLYGLKYISLYFYLVELKNITYVSPEDLYKIFEKFAAKYISKGLCLVDKTKIPMSEVIDLSSQIEKRILENNVVLSFDDKFSASEDSLRTLAFEMVRSRCIRGKELRTSFKQLDKVYHLDDIETKEALKDKRQLPLPFCCLPSCECTEFLMKDMIKTLPSLIKTKLDKFVVELEVLDKIVVNSLLKSSEVTSSSQLRKKISRRPLVDNRSEKMKTEIMKEFLENLIISKECKNITYQKLMEKEVTTYKDNKVQMETLNEVDNMKGTTTSNMSKSESSNTISDNDKTSKENNNGVIENKVLPSTIDDDSNGKPNKKDVAVNQGFEGVTKSDDNKDGNISPQQSGVVSSEDTETSTISISNTKSSINTAERKVVTKANAVESEIKSRTTIRSITTPLPRVTSTNSIISTTRAATQRTTRRPGGLFNRTPSRRQTTTAPTTTLATTVTTTKNFRLLTTSAASTTTQPPTTIAKRRFNPFLRNVFNRG